LKKPWQKKHCKHKIYNTFSYGGGIFLSPYFTPLLSHYLMRGTGLIAENEV